MTGVSHKSSRSVDSHSGSETTVPDGAQDYLYSSYLRSINKRLTFFTEEIVGCVIDIHYPEDAGRFICQVVEYSAEHGWHKVKSVNHNGVAVNLESNTTEEDFTDEVDLNAFWRDRRVQFIGMRDSPFVFCPVCKWQAAPAASCISCTDCGHLTHLRCAARASGLESIDFSKESIEEYTCASCCRTSTRSPQLGISAEPNPYSVHYATPSTPPANSSPLSPSATAFDELDGWTDDIVADINAEFWNLQPDGARKFKFISGTEYLNQLCNGSVNHAMTALQHCSTAGVLSWVYEDGSESENCRIIKRGLDANDPSVQLLVCIADLSPTNQPRLSSKPPSQAWCCHMTYGFAAISGLLKTTRTRDSLRSQYGQILIFACRSSQARSIDELHSVISERVWSSWTVLDNADGQLIDTVEQVQTHSSLMYTVQPIPAPCKTPEEIYLLTPPSRSGRRGMAAVPPADIKDKSTRQVLNEIFVPGGMRTRNGQTTQSSDKSITRANWDASRFTLVHRGLNHEGAYLPNLPTPSRLLFGAVLRLFQTLQYRVVLLELALPISDEIRHHGQGREIEVVTSHGFRSLTRPAKLVERDEVRDWPAWMPTTGDMVLASTTNTAAYKTYRAFGLGEHCVWNAIGCNASQNYKYPVLGCVLEQDHAGGVGASDIRRVSVRAGEPLRGIASWIAGLKRRHNKASHEPSVVSRLIEGGGYHLDDPDTKDWMDSLHLFETVMDQVKPGRLGVAPMTLSPKSRVPDPAPPASKKARKNR